MITKNFNGQNGVATSANVKVRVIDVRNNGGNYKWQIERVNAIKDYFNASGLDMSKVDVEIVVNSREVIVIAEYDGVKYSENERISAKTSISRVRHIMLDSFHSLILAVANDAIASEQVEDEEYEDVDYLVSIFNEKMVEDITNEFESSLGSIRSDGEWHTESGQICGVFSYEKDYEHEWVEFYHENGNGGINHAYDIFRDAPDFTSVDFFNEDDAEELVDELGEKYGVGIEDYSWGECLVWVKNPYYVSEVDNAPCLDNDVDRVVNTIKYYVANYIPSYLDQFGDCVITIGWDEFSESDMQMLIEDDVFEGLVIDNLVGENISDMLVYDDGVYVTVDYDKMFNKVA